jgi:hypothetical protein
MSFDAKRYPADWKTISLRIRVRDGNRCQHCGVENDALILRSTVNPARYLVYRNFAHYTSDGQPIRWYEMPDEFANSLYTTVVLTVHHIGAPKLDGAPGDIDDKMDCRDENLISLCQRCHFIADLPNHIEKARKTRISRKHKCQQEQGQLTLFEGGE